MAPTPPEVLTFDEHELRLDSGELFRGGAPVKLQPQPAKVLEVLARRAGEVVSREEIQALVWGEETFLDADASLNFCIKQVRRALEDPAVSPRYIETIPRRGYRFLVPATLRRLEPPRPARRGARASGPDPPVSPVRPRRLPWAGFAAAAALVLLALFAAMQRPVSRARLQPAPVAEGAREHYRTALYVGPADPEKAIEELRKAILLEPRYAEAHARLAWEESRLERPPAEVLPQLEITARRAVELAPDLALAHRALGKVLFATKLDWKNGEAELRRSLELDPEDAEAWHTLAFLLAGRGEGEAIAAARRARDLDPEGMLVNTDLAWFYYLGREYDEAVRQAANVLALKTPGANPGANLDAPFFRWSWKVILYSSLRTGDRRAGIDAARALVAGWGSPATAGKLVDLADYWRLEEKRMASRPAGPRLDFLAQNAVASGRNDLALSYLEVACRRRWPILLLVAAADPLFDPLRGNPRFEKFLDCIGVPEDAPARKG